MVKILVTDAVGLVGAFVIDALVHELDLAESRSRDHSIVAGYHSNSELSSALRSNRSPLKHPVLVDWDNNSTWRSSVRGVDSVLLLTRFTSRKQADVESWMSIIAHE